MRVCKYKILLQDQVLFAIWESRDPTGIINLELGTRNMEHKELS